MKDIYNKIADIIFNKIRKIAYEDSYEIAIEILKLPELKAIPLGAEVKVQIAGMIKNDLGYLNQELQSLFDDDMDERDIYKVKGKIEALQDFLKEINASNLSA